MVNGLEIFREHFKSFSDNYVIIGGTACDVLLSGEGFFPRATKDIDLIVVVENLTTEFISRLWEFLKAGKYESLQKDSKERKYYRFTKPREKYFPRQIELFSRIPDSIDGEYASHLVHLSVDDASAYTLSAILLNDIYYTYTIEHSSIIEDLHRADIESLICLKAKAYLDLEDRKSKGEKVDEDDIKKHKNDIFRLAVLLPQGASFEFPLPIKEDFRTFTEKIKNALPDTAILDAMGATGLNMAELFDQLCRNFNLPKP